MNYTLDLAAGLTQVLSDSTNTYLYGNGRISQHTTQAEYFLGDALGSVRQMTGSTGDVIFTQSYDPYGVVTQTAGASHTNYGFTNEYTDTNGLVYLRARYYAPSDGRFINRDTWGGYMSNPMSFNRWNYVDANPVNAKDPTGHIKEDERISADSIVIRLATQGIRIDKDWGVYVTFSTISPLATAQCGWASGNWELEELRWTEEALDDLKRVLGGWEKFRSTYTGVTIRRTGDILSEIPAYAPPGITSVAGDIVMQDYLFNSSKDYAKFTIIHEFGHVWDYKTGKRLSSELMDLVGGWVCNGSFCVVYPSLAYERPPDFLRKCLNQNTASSDSECQELPYSYQNTGAGDGTENWAQAFAFFAYESQGGYRPDLYIGLKKIRRQYVKKQIANLP